MLGVHLLAVRRILVVPYTRCAVATTTEAEIRAAITAASGVDASWQQFHVVDDQRRALAGDLQRVRTHPLVGDRAIVGGFIYDVDTGLLHPLEDD